MATIKISDLAPVTNVADSEMSYIELTEQQLKSLVGGKTYDPGGGCGRNCVYLGNGVYICF